MTQRGWRQAMKPEAIIRHLSGLKTGRRGFGGTHDAVEAAAFRRELQDDRELNPGLISAPSTALRPAAVLVPLINHSPGHPDGMTVLLTQRTAHLTAHAGQISFPGGRIEEHDPDPIAAALRETEEEVGVPRERVGVIGRLDTYITGTGFEITPIVGMIEPPFPLAIDPFEVAEAFEVPLSYILDRRNHQRVERNSAGRTRSFFILPYQGRNIWGATAGILVNLAEVLAD
jgi:8-oxo-dGTP pyrophosphatase MutT (NUDIX family)